MKRTGLGILLGVAGVLFFSTKAVFVKLAYLHDIDSVSLLLLRMLFALPFYLGTLFFLGKPKERISGKTYFFIFLAGFLGYYLASYLDFLGLKFIKASVERLILFTYPTIVILLSWAFLKKKISKGQTVALIASYCGIFLVFAPELTGENSNIFLGGILVFLSGISYALYIVGSGWLIPKIGAFRFTSYCMIVSCMLVIVHFSIEKGDFMSLQHYPAAVYGYGIAMALVSTIIPSYLVSYAIKTVGASQFAIYGTLGPISTVVLAFFFLSEVLYPLQAIGGVVIVGAVMLAEKTKV